MGVRGVVGVAAALVALVGAGSALADTGTVTIQVDLPKQAPVPAAAFAYPLDPALDPVGASMPKGRSTLRLEAGGWIVVTVTPRTTAPPAVAARLVVVRAGKRAPFATAGATGGGPTIAIGTMATPGLHGRPALEALAASMLTEAVAKERRPCEPGIARGKVGSNPVWKAVQQTAAKAARSGPRELRDAARAVVSALQAASTRDAGATLSGSFTRITSIGNSSATMRLTRNDGSIIWEKQYASDPDTILRLAAEDAIDTLCNERDRLQVNATIAFDTQNEDVRMSAVVVLQAVAIERLLPDGTVEKGAYENDAPLVYSVRDQAIQGLACPATITEIIDASPPVFLPSTLVATQRDGSYLVFLAPALGANYDQPSPCGADSISFSAPAAPGIRLAVPALDRLATKNGSSPIPLPNLTGSYAVEVELTRLPPAQ